jgi:DNA-binding beta-propeller fold protein YncE
MLLVAPATAGAFGPVGSFDGTGSGSGQFNHPQSAAVSGNRVYVADTANNRVAFYDPAGTFQGTLGSPPSSPQDVAANGTTVVAAGPSQVVRWLAGVPLPAISPPGTSYGAALDGSGAIYVSDAQNGVIHKYDVLGNFQGDIGAGQLFQPQGMTSDGGSVYVADPGNGRIVRFDLAGNLIGIWTMPSYTIVANGQTFTGRIEPHDVAVDGSGRVFAPDAGTHSNLVAVFGADGSFQQIFGSPDSDPANPCAVRGPWGLAVTGSTLYVVSTGENRVRIFDDAATPCPAVNFGAGGGINASGAPAGVAADRRKPKIKFSGFPKGRCTRRNFAFLIRASDDVLLSRLTLFVNHRRVARQTVNKAEWTVRVRIPTHKLSKQIPRGSSARVLITVQVRDASGKKASRSRSFGICGAA